MGKIPLISVVDDDDSVRESLQRLIRSVGFAVEVFSSAEEFLNSERLRNTLCLILDVRMPGMDGLELQRQLVASHREVPVVFISAHGDAPARSQALKDGAVDFLLKPFSEEALLNAIHTALSRNDVTRRRIEPEKDIEIDEKSSHRQFTIREEEDESCSTHTMERNKFKTNTARLFLRLMKRSWRYALLRSFRHARASALIYRALAECEPDEIRSSMLMRLAQHADRRANLKANHLRKLGACSADRDPPASRAWRWLLVRFGMRWALAWIHRLEHRDLVLSAWLVRLTTRVVARSHIRGD
jgi:FixJ family two-component response regulator